MTGPLGRIGSEAVRGGPGGGRGGPGGRPGGGRRRPPPLRVAVARTEQLSPHLVRVTVAGAALAGFDYPGPASHFKILLPSVAGAPLVLPTPGEDGLVGFSAAVPVTLRTYTARAFRPEAGELDIDFFAHGDGPAASWASAAKPGDEIGVTSPRRSGFSLDPAAQWVVLAGDASAIPALGTILETGPSADVQCLVEIDDAGDAVPFAGTYSQAIEWVIRPDGAAPGSALRAAIAARSVRSGPGAFWIAGEAAAIRQIRADLLAADHQPGSTVVTRGYWRLGQSNHPDHDDGSDPIS